MSVISTFPQLTSESLPENCPTDEPIELNRSRQTMESFIGEIGFESATDRVVFVKGKKRGPGEP